MKKEIGVLTFHKAVSYGAAYQTYALQTYLNGIGYDVKIVDYIPPRFTTFNSIFSMPANGNKVKKIIKFIPYVLSKATSVYMLQRFNKKYLTLTDSYCTEQELIDSDLRFDTFITGSDQVWNLEFDKFENIRPYLLSFTKQKKISYAASIGMTSFEGCPEKILHQFINLLNQYDSISVREVSAKILLDSIGIESEWVLDPTFLLKRSDWEKISQKPKESSYVLVYGLYRNKTLYKIAKSIAKNNGLKIVNVSDNYDFCSSAKNKVIITHEQLLGYLMNAECVVTDSFHGLALSVNFNTPFYVVPAKRYNTRIDSLLKMFELSNRCITEENSFPSDYVINFERVNSKLKIEREKAYYYLQHEV